MNTRNKPKDKNLVAEARESFSGRPLTDPQFSDVTAICGIVKREIRKNGTFTDKLGDYAYAFARTENFDVGRAETILRDVFRVLNGQTMNQMREGLLKRVEKLTEAQKRTALDHAIATGNMIEQGDKIAFHRAYAHHGQTLADELDITDADAKRLIKDAFREAQGTDFYEWGKEIEEKFYRPQIEAEKQQRQEAAEVNESGTRTRSQSGSSRSRMQYRR